MATTTHHTLTAAAWTLVADGLENVSLQVPSAYPARVHVGAASPAVGTLNYLRLSEGTGGSMAFGSLAAGDKVYARAENEDAPLVVVAG